MIGKVTRVSGSTVYVSGLADYPRAEVKARAVVYRTTASPETFTTYKPGDAVHVVDDEEGGLLVTGVIR